ncbi:LOW QUALITY PROTEIN: mucin-20 [Phascolarctos cinereus]|uniref:LOW QUALITY PROTEIN: mucin-20 n=1 Tax=Phascolarctos cinereus TaxID=38626 RepID=A0A6P5KAT2_PHACI|nr:LOW QUALITY PROTEIN: mucin-20 [Phascolarctos cinereus]
MGGTTRTGMGPDVNNTDKLVEINSTETTTVTPGGPTTSERIFGSTRLYENSAVTYTSSKSKTSLASETLAPAGTAYKAETKIAESFSPVETLMITDALDKMETTTLLESTNPTTASVTVISESGTAIDKTRSQAKTLTIASSTTEAEVDTTESLASAETWRRMSIFCKVVWKSLIEPPLLPLPPHQKHGKHRHHPKEHHDYLQSVTDYPWTSPLNSSIPENYETGIKTSIFTEAMTTTDTSTESEISNPFRTIILEETSGIMIPPGKETVIVEEILPFTLLDEFTEIVDTAGNTLEREGTPIKTTTLPGTLTTASPITEATMLTSNLIDTFPIADSTQEIKTTTAVALSMAYTNTEAETTSPEIDTSAEPLDVAGNNLQPKTIGEKTTLTGDITETIGTRAKTTIFSGSSMTIDSSTEEGTSVFLKTDFFSETSASSSSAEDELSSAVETLTTTNTITMAVSTTAETPNAAETLGTTGHTVETTGEMATDTLNTIYIPTTEEATAPTETAVFPEVPSTVMISKFTTPGEFSDKVYTTTEGTTAPGINSSGDKTLTSGKTPAIVSTIGKHTVTALMNQNTNANSRHDGGFLLLRLIVSSSLDLTDHKVAKELLHKLHQDLQVQVPYTQISLMKVTKY